MQRHGEQIDALRGEARGAGGGVLRGVVAIREKDDAAGLAGGEDRAGKIERAADVRGLALRQRRPLRGRLQVRGGRLPELGPGSESDDTGGIIGMLRRETRRDEIAGFFLCRSRDAR